MFKKPGFNSKGYHPAAYAGSGCNGCGYCFYACPEPAAVTVYKKGAEIPISKAGTFPEVIPQGGD